MGTASNEACPPKACPKTLKTVGGQGGHGHNTQNKGVYGYLCHQREHRNELILIQLCSKEYFATFFAEIRSLLLMLRFKAKSIFPSRIYNLIVFWLSCSNISPHEA